MRSYYQQLKTDYTLHPAIYAKTVKTIAAYYQYKKIVDTVNNKSDITYDDVNERMVADCYIKAIHKSLRDWVNRDYRKACFDHVVKGIGYIELEEKYYLSISSMKRWVQVFVYGVAKELGEEFQ